MKSNYNSLVKKMNTNMKTILHSYEMNTTYHKMHYLVVVGLLHLFDPYLHERIPFEYHLNYHESLYVGYCLLFLIFNLSTKNVISTHCNQMALYLILVMILVMLLAPLKTKPRFLNHL